jgi:hypothetical protein
MARRSIKVRQVFVELRRALGVEIPAGELLRLSATLVAATYPIESPDPDRRSGYLQAFDDAPLDRAFSDGGWRVMHREASWAANAYRDDDPAFAAVNRGSVKVALAG